MIKEFYKIKLFSTYHKRSRNSGFSILSYKFNKCNSEPVYPDNVCSYCKETFNKQLWCEKCDPRNIIEGWTSGNIDVDKFIKDTMYSARQADNYYSHFLEWIPFVRLTNIEKIGEASKPSRRISSFKPLLKVALKKLNKSTNDMSMVYLNKLKLHWNINLKDINNQLKFYGITENPETGEFMIVTELAEQGNLRDYLSKNFNNILWKEKISLLSDIISNLKYLHNSGYFHKNLHSGNILLNDGCAHISDFALSGSMSDDQEDKLYGVLPYIAPEVLYGEPYTSSSDIYSFGVIMTELSSGIPPFYDKCHDVGLASAIFKGLRPKFGPVTPKIFKKLACKCMSSDPNKRPTTDDIDYILKFWYRSIKTDNCYQERELFDYKGKDIKAMFKESDDEIPVISTSYRKNPYAIYNSRVLEFNNILNPSRMSYISSNEDSYDDSIYPSRSSMSLNKSNSIHTIRPSIVINDNESLYEKKSNSIYTYRSYISVNKEEPSSISVNESEISYERNIDSIIYFNRLKSIDEFEEKIS
ncbi:kinase-like domain-containing protein [Rhizophagus clarus]|uniref:Kinase-like domain-containing protein n=1 Tax=Rhizophagus clarus TaxID=94130 RepID=A0A8H3QAS8_9GLOM|nr:kinase-like domain-containing protein [Rhizophagus clarus]